MEVKVSEILSRYDTDKVSHHHYGVPYDKLFARFDRSGKLNILEIGTQKGGSLLAWKEYFPNSNVYGVDIVDVVLEEYRLDTVHRIVSDIKDYKSDLSYDIVIDDGSHYLGDVVYVIAQYARKIRPNGMLIIEDVRNPQLLVSVASDLLEEIRLGFPDYNEGAKFEVRGFDCRRSGAEESFLMALVRT